MNIKRELKILEYKKKFKNIVYKIFNIFKYYLCTHRNVEEFIISVSLGNTSTSILEELLGEKEAKKCHKMYIKTIKCSNCGRELFREIIKEEVFDNNTEVENEKT